MRNSKSMIEELEKQFDSKISFANRPVLTRLASYSQHYSDTTLSHLVLHSNTKYSYMCAQDVQTHTYIANCNSIKVKYLLHRISHHKVNTKFAQRQYYYNHSGITSPSATGTPTSECLPSSPGHPLETLHIHYLLPIWDFHWM